MSSAPIRPRFVDWSEPALPAVARALAEEHATAGALRLAHLILVFPGGRAGRRMLELLVAEAERRGAALEPPRTVTTGVLPELLYEPEAPLADPVLRRRVWARALRRASASRLQVLLPQPPADSDLAGWAALAGMVDGLHRELAGEGISFADVAGACRRGPLGFDDSERWDALARVHESYRSELESLGRRDPHDARLRALAAGEVSLARGAPDLFRSSPDGGREAAPGPDPALHLVGVTELPAVLRRMLGAVAEDGTPVVPWIHAPAALAERFDALGCVAPEAWETAEVEVPDAVLAFRDRPAHQAEEALGTLAGWGREVAADEVTVGVPDASLVPFLEQRFEAYGVPHRDAAGTPLERTAPYRLLAACADYLDGRRFTDLAALLRHPDLERHLGADGVLDRADSYFTFHLPAQVTLPLPAGSDESDRILQRIVHHLESEELLGPLRTGRRPLAEWMPRILGLLQRVYDQGPLDRSVPAERRLLEALEAVRDRAADFHRLPDAVDEACGSASAIRLLLAEVRASGAAVPPEADRSAVEILGWLELHLDDAPALVLTGANEPFLPESLGADPFLPNGLRRLLGLADDRSRYARDAYLLSALLRSRERVRVIAGKTDAAGDPLRPSRLLLTGPADATARRLLRFLEEEAPTSPAPLGLAPADESGFHVPPEAPLPLERPPESISVTDFRILIQDPYRWMLERRLGLAELHDGARELDGSLFGTLAHDVLSDFGRSEDRNASDARVVERRLTAILDRLVDARFPRPLPAVPIQVEQLRSRLRSFARWHADWIGQGWRVAATEAHPVSGDEGVHGVPFDVDGTPILLKGRIDRIDVHEETGRIAVLDYKTGEKATDPDRAHRSGDDWKDLQLPLYRHLLAHLLDPEGAPLLPWLRSPEGAAALDAAGSSARLLLGYVQLPKSEAKTGAAFVEWDRAILASADEEARRWVRWLRDRPEVPFDPAARIPRWDPLGALLGRGALTAVAPGDDEEDEG